MLNLINDLRVLIEIKESTKQGIKNEMSFNSQEWDITNLFEDLMKEAQNELYHDCLEFSSLNFSVKLMHIKDLNNYSNKSFDMLL